MPLTYFVALPFVHNDTGDLVAGEGERRLSPHAASAAARRMAEKAAGAIAFSRTGEPASGDYETAVIIATTGTCPRSMNSCRTTDAGAEPPGERRNLKRGDRRFAAGTS